MRIVHDQGRRSRNSRAIPMQPDTEHTQCSSQNGYSICETALDERTALAGKARVLAGGSRK